MAITKKVAERIQSKLRTFCPILQAQRNRDVSEADTVTLIKDVLSDVFGFDKYAEVSSEHAIRSTFCDLAVSVDGKLHMLIEVKAIGLELNERHIKQAVDYGANQGVEWVVLTNGIEWILYRLVFRKPIDKEEIVRVNLLSVDSKSEEDLEKLFLLSREGAAKNALREYHERLDATNRFLIAAILQNSESVMSALRREIRRATDFLVEPDAVLRVLREQVIKREVLEGDQAVEASRRFARVQAAVERKRSKDDDEDPPAPKKSMTVDQSGGPTSAAPATSG